MADDAKSLYGAADVRYIASYQPEVSPARLQFSLAMANTAWQPQDRDGLKVLDIGCGRGVTVHVLAAANPGWEVIGLDLQPVHVAEARRVAADAGLDNARFIEADVTELDEDRATRLLPELDVVICHGVWTWVPDSVREGIVRLLRHRLKPGGIAYFGYNAMPGWTDSLALQRLFELSAAGFSGTETQRATQALELLDRMRKAGALSLPNDVVLDMIVETSSKMPSYMFHEWMTSFWRPVFHADLARALVPARLEYGGCARPARSMPAIQLTEAQRAILADPPPGFDHETLADFFRDRRFRTDIFVRGREGGGHRMLPAFRLALAASPEASTIELKTPRGQMTLPEPTSAALLGALAEGPKRIADLQQLPGCDDLSALDLAVMLVESGVAHPVWRDRPDDEATKQRLLRCHKAFLGHFGEEMNAVKMPLGAAVPMLGTGLPISFSHLAVLTALQDGVPPDAGRLVAFLTGGSYLPEDMRNAEEGIANILAHTLPAWRALGIV